MKVGRITLLSAFLLVLPVAAFAGGDPCAMLGGDADGDTICESVDNCPGVANTAQTNSDTDGRGDACDNCRVIANGPGVWATGLFGPAQCDRDSDGYGNACDGDLNQNGTVTPLDNPLYLAALMAFIPPPPGQADMTCNGTMTPLDNPWYQAQLMAFLPGPSGWACAGMVTGVCPGLP